MAEKPRVLLVDDDPKLREVVRFALTREGYAVFEAQDGADGLRSVAQGSFDLIVLDIMMPELDGTEVCREIRRHSSVPILFLSSKDSELDRILGLELGGDDYVTKPFSVRELVARIRALLRRSRAVPTEPARLLKVDRLTIDLDRHRVSWDDQEVILTVTEFGLLKTLAAFPEKVFTRTELMERAYQEQTVVSDRTIDSHIRRLRQKLAAAGGLPIETVQGVGYRLLRNS
jgi:two-component system OmpR family response regulator